MQLHTTAKAHLALWPGTQTLALRERSLLLLAERQVSAVQLRCLFNGMGEQIVSDLLRDGYLAPAASLPPAGERPPVPELSAEPLDD